MSIKNFIPTVWSEAIERDLAVKCVFAEDCNRQYEGKVKELGESVKILGVGKPTVYTINRADAGKKIHEAEKLEDSSVIMNINQMSYFNFMVDDVDKLQAQGDVMSAVNSEASEVLAAKMDAHIAQCALDESIKKLFATAQKVVTGTAASGSVNVLELLDDAVTVLYENDVAQSTKIVVNVSPRFYKLFRREYGTKDTDNSEILKTGRVAQYGNILVKMTNNVATTENGAVDNIMIRTQRAIAFANPYTHTEAYRPENYFADAVKGFTLYQAKVVRPKEMLTIPVKYA